MINSKIDDKSFMRDMNNIIKYAEGFLEGVKLGKNQFLNAYALKTAEVISQFIDSNARINPESLHHVYEWYEAGQKGGRLFDINYTITGLGISMRSTFRQSISVKNGSKVPFYDKARIMEDGVPVTIKPTNRVLAFDDNGEAVFTSQPVTVTNPGGDVKGNFEEIFDMFFRTYFTQSFLTASGIGGYLKNPTAFKKNFNRGKSGGRSTGVSTGFRWIVGAGAEAA